MIYQNILNQSTYQPALQIAEIVENQFAKQFTAARLRGEQNLASEPKAQAIEAILDVAFWASLRREEGHAPKISLAYLPPEQSNQPLLFENRLPLTAENLTKLSPGFEPSGIHLGVWPENDDLYIWGITRVIPKFCFVLDVSQPGLLVVKYRRGKGLGKFSNVAVLFGNQIKIIDESSARMPDSPEILSSLVGFAESTSQEDSVNVLVQLAVAMRAHGRGGILLVVPANDNAWKASVLHPLKFSIKPASHGLANLMQFKVGERDLPQWKGEFRHEVENIASFTAMDGATIINDQFQLMAFGTKLVRRIGNPNIERLFYTEPVLGDNSKYVDPSESGGTRHLSAAQFVHDQKDCMALVASQDGRFTVFSWSSSENIVQAHRIDILLL